MKTIWNKPSVCVFSSWLILGCSSACGLPIINSKTSVREPPFWMTGDLVPLPRRVMFACLLVCLAVSVVPQKLPGRLSWNLVEGWSTSRRRNHRFWSGSESQGRSSNVFSVFHLTDRTSRGWSGRRHTHVLNYSESFHCLHIKFLVERWSFRTM